MARTFEPSELTETIILALVRAKVFCQVNRQPKQEAEYTALLNRIENEKLDVLLKSREE